MLTITSRDAPSPVAGRRVTVYLNAQTRQKLNHRTQQYHPESTGAGPDRPWASTVSHDASVPSRQEDAHTSSYCRSYYESLPSRPRHPQYAGLTLHHSTITSWGACPRRRSSKSSSCDLCIDVT